MNPKVKRIIAREGLIILCLVISGILSVLSTSLFVRGDEGATTLFPLFLGLFLMFGAYPLYLLIRFVIWAFRTIFEPEDKEQKTEINNPVTLMPHLSKEEIMKASSQICPNCNEKNNPSFRQCWKCNYSFATGKIEPIKSVEEIQEIVKDEDSKIFSVYINNNPSLLSNQNFLIFLSQKSNWDLERTKAFLAVNPNLRIRKLTKGQAKSDNEELKRIGVNSLIINDVEELQNEYKKDTSIAKLSIKNPTCIECGSSKTIAYKPDYFWDFVLLLLAIWPYVIIVGNRSYKCFCANCGCRWEQR